MLAILLDCNIRSQEERDEIKREDAELYGDEDGGPSEHETAEDSEGISEFSEDEGLLCYSPGGGSGKVKWARFPIYGIFTTVYAQLASGSQFGVETSPSYYGADYA